MKHLYEIWLLAWLAVPWSLGAYVLILLVGHFYFRWLWGNMYEGDIHVTKYDYAPGTKYKLVAVGEKSARPVILMNGDSLIEMGRLGYLTGAALADYKNAKAERVTE